MSGLSAARSLGDDCLLLEREQRIGGLCHTVSLDGYLFDNPSHVLHTGDPDCVRLMAELGTDRFATHRRRAFVFSHGVFTHYPFQASLFGLPDAVIAECVSGFREARRRPTPGPPADFREWSLDAFGEGIARHFLFPYCRKLFCADPSELTCDWADRFIPRPTEEEVVRGAACSEPSGLGYHATFAYPRNGGIDQLPGQIVERLPVPPRTGSAVTHVDAAARRVTLADGERVPYRHLVSSIPLPEILRLLDQVPEPIAAAASRLRHVSVLNYNLVVRRRPVFDGNWIYFPEPQFPFYRVGFPARAGAHLAPGEGDMLHAEIAYAGPLPDEDATRRAVLEGLRAAGLLREEDTIVADGFTPTEYAYVVYDRERAAAVEAIHGFLAARDITAIGRYGRWEYSSIGDALRSGRRAAEALQCPKNESTNRSL